VQQIVFRDRADGEAAQAELASGKTFEDVAKARNLGAADYDLGFITKDKIIDPAVADAAFMIPENSVSPIIDGRFGPVLVNVRGAQEEIVIPFEDSKADLKNQIAIERAAADILNIRDSIEDARAGGASLAEAAAKFDLKLTQVAAMDSGGRDPMGNPIPMLPVAVLSGAFMSDVGIENDPVEPDPQSFAWYEVAGITQPRDRTLDEVRDRVVAAWKDDQRQRRLDERTAAMKTRLDAGETLETVAAAEMLTVQTADKVTRLTEPSGEFSAATLARVFMTGKGQAAVAPAASPMTSVVLTLDEITDPPFSADDPSLASIKDQLNQQITTNILATYAVILQNQTDVRLNQNAIATAVGVTTPTQ
jgi:peptidyl-prolyl cis-trans isomerase D